MEQFKKPNKYIIATNNLTIISQHSNLSDEMETTQNKQEVTKSLAQGKDLSTGEVALKFNEPITKEMAQMTVCNQNVINLIDGRNKKTHVCELKAKKEEPLAFKPKILKKSEVLRVN